MRAILHPQLSACLVLPRQPAQGLIVRSENLATKGDKNVRGGAIMIDASTKPCVDPSFRRRNADCVSHGAVARQTRDELRVA